MRVRQVMLVLLTTAVSGCTLAPHYERPAAPVPLTWPVGDAYLRQSEAALPAVRFADIFRDSRLQALVSQALTNNRDLRIAAANVLAAQQRVSVQQAQQLPVVGGSLGATRRAGGTGGSSSTANSASTTVSASVGLSAFELDLFGRLASATAAERNAALATEAAARTVRVTLLASLAAAWTAHAADSELLRIGEATAANARRAVVLTTARLQGGVAPRSDVRQAEELLAAAEADVAAQRTALAQDRNLIDLLAGSSVDPALLPVELEPVLGSIQALSAGQSSDVLLRRPDVIEAEYRLREANADVGVARAALFPRISLTGLLGLASESLAGLFSGGGSATSTLGASGNYAIFAGGGARANLRVSQAQREAAVAGYERAVQVAFREVADALAGQGTIGEQLAAVRRQADATADTARLVEARYRGGVASSLENLDAQRSDYAARRRVVTTAAAYVNNRIELYRALGGDPAMAGKTS